MVHHLEEHLLLAVLHLEKLPVLPAALHLVKLPEFLPFLQLVKLQEYLEGLQLAFCVAHPWEERPDFRSVEHLEFLEVTLLLLAIFSPGVKWKCPTLFSRELVSKINPAAQACYLGLFVQYTVVEKGLLR